MRPEFECGAAASFLHGGGTLAVASHCGAAIGAAGVLLSHSVAARLIFATAVLCWPAACYCSLRVAIDASLFQVLAQGQGEEGPALDTWLTARGFVGAVKERTLADRIGGALRLWRRLIAIVAVQLAALIAGIVMQVLAN